MEVESDFVELEEDVPISFEDYHHLEPEFATSIEEWQKQHLRNILELSLLIQKADRKEIQNAIVTKTAEDLKILNGLTFAKRAEEQLASALPAGESPTLSLPERAPFCIQLPLQKDQPILVEIPVSLHTPAIDALLLEHEKQQHQHQRYQHDNNNNNEQQRQDTQVLKHEIVVMPMVALDDSFESSITDPLKSPLVLLEEDDDDNSNNDVLIPMEDFNPQESTSELLRSNQPQSASVKTPIARSKSILKEQTATKKGKLNNKHKRRISWSDTAGNTLSVVYEVPYYLETKWHRFRRRHRYSMILASCAFVISVVALVLVLFQFLQ